MAEAFSDVFDFLGRIQADQELREKLNLVETAEEVAELARGYGHNFNAAELEELFERCNEAPRARLGLMDEKLVRVWLRRTHLV
jgi:predicted ribosomally synthesized peptide with nif11-like leader